MKKVTQDMEALKAVLNKSKSRNTRFVKVKTSRYCQYCDNQIDEGTTCLTTNRKLQGRRWICLACLDAILRYNETKVQMNLVAFDDEGAYMALSDFLEEDMGELYSRGILK